MTGIRRSIGEFGVFSAAVLLDQWSKWVVFRRMELGTSKEVLGQFFRLTYIHNPNAAFGITLFGGGFHLLLSLAALGLLFFIMYRTAPSQRAIRIALSMILGGAIGNLIDRIRMGEVIDFLDVGIGRYHWPVFNVADIAVTVGMILLLFSYFGKSAQQSAEEVKEEGRTEEDEDPPSRS
ncbi:MAG: signal peptidase II [Candidatus Latescibacterota bacterium]